VTRADIHEQLFTLIPVATVPVNLEPNQTRPRDQYGRTLAVVLADGRDVAEPLIATGLVRPWRGRSSNWCN
jgi:endonuclease YncB( thermonuclease family)